MNDIFRSHFIDPRNAHIPEKYSYMSENSSPVCGDTVTLYILTDGDKITDAGYEVYGCSASVASASSLSEMIIGSDMAYAEHISAEDISSALGGLPENRIGCTAPVLSALRSCVQQWASEVKN